MLQRYTFLLFFFQDSPQKPPQDQGVTVGASLMSPLAFQPSGKVAILAPQSQPKPPPKLEIAPLTQDQLVQALTYLLKVIHTSKFIFMVMNEKRLPEELQNLLFRTLKGL